MKHHILAQINYGNERAGQIINDSLRLHQNTSESWQRLWDISVNPGEPLWQALCQLGGFIAAVSLIYLMVKESSDRSLDLTKVIEMAKFPLGIGVLLIGNGYYLAGLILYMRSVSLFWLTRILNMTFAGVSIHEAIGKIQNTSVANARAREIFSECIDKTGTALAECVQDPIKLQQAEALLQNLSGSNAPLNGTILEQVVDRAVSSLVGAINIPFVNAMTFLLNILQWGFVNLIEASLLLTAIFCPVALGLSILPATGPTIFKWLSGYISLLLMPLGYVIIVGFTANVLVLTEKAGQPLGSSFIDVAFLLFISFFAPLIAVRISKGIGDGVYEGISRGVKLTSEAGMAAISSGSSMAAKAMAAKAAEAEITAISS